MTLRDILSDIDEAQTKLNNLYRLRSTFVRSDSVKKCPECFGEGSFGREYNEQTCGNCYGLGVVDK